jgi:hypothetical protein
MTTIDFLDQRTPVRITAGSTFFDQIASAWEDSKTVVDLMKREATDQARYAYRVAQQMRPAPQPRPQFYPKATISETQPIPVITDMPLMNGSQLMAQLEKTWDEYNERPVANLTRKRRVPFIVRRAFWLIVDGPRDIIEAIDNTWNRITS